MKFSSFVSSTLLGAMLLLPLSASAGLITYAATTNVNNTFVGGDNIDYSYNEANSQNKALVSLSGDDLLPTIKVMSASSGYSYAEALAVQKYTFLGDDTNDYTLNFNLHGSVNSSAYSPLRADIGVVIADEAWFYSQYGFATNFFEGAGLGGDIVGYEALFLGNGDDQNTSKSISFSINPGQSFFVYASMESRAKNGYVDAWNTLTMNFDDSTNLLAGSFIPAQVSVPEPSTYLLLLLSLLLFTRKIRS